MTTYEWAGKLAEKALAAGWEIKEMKVAGTDLVYTLVRGEWESLWRVPLTMHVSRTIEHLLQETLGPRT